MVRVAMISRWHVHADQYAKQIQENENACITAVWDDDIERGKAWAEELGCPFYADYAALLASSEVDAVAVVTSTNLHTDILVQAANAKKHIFTEKVLAFTKEEAEKIKEAVVRNQVKFVISYPHKTFPKVLQAKKMVDNGEIGKVTYMRVRNVHAGSIRNWLPSYFYDKTLCGGGAMMDLGAHPMYLLNWFLGKPEKVASAFTDVTGRGVEDNAVSVMTFPGGAIGVSETGFVSLCDPYTIEISGTEGYIHMQETLRYKNEASGREWKEAVLPQEGKMPLDCWIESILTGKENDFYGIDEAVALSAIMEAAYQSDETDKIVHF